jgi:hypothetical protein
VKLKTLFEKQLEESLNTTVPVLKTSVNSHENFIVYHSTLDTDPQLFVDVRLTNFDDEKTVADVVFYPATGNFKALNTFGTKGGLSIFNTVIKLCEQYLEDVDVWFFSAKFAENADEKQYLKRTDLYDRLSERMCRKHSLYLSSFNPGNDKVWVAAKTKVTDADIKRFVDYCSQL